jgi:hypothetical protein
LKIFHYLPGFAKHLSCLPRCFLTASWLFLPSIVSAFPPAPYYTVFGDVRDASGTLLHPEGASIIVKANGRELQRQSLLDGSNLGFNYVLRLRLEMQRPGTDSYSSLALGLGTTFTLEVSVDGLVYLPIEMSTPPQTGNPAERIRIDLTLGVDTDGDGLPDAWEESQLYRAGILPDENGWNLALLHPDGDFDNDGFTDRQEYISGTYAVDRSSFLWLKVAEVSESANGFDFYAIFGRLYILQSSTDMVNWHLEPIATENPEISGDFPDMPFLRATGTGVTRIYASRAEPTTIYRLINR